MSRSKRSLPSEVGAAARWCDQFTRAAYRVLPAGLALSLLGLVLALVVLPERLAQAENVVFLLRVGFAYAAALIAGLGVRRQIVFWRSATGGPDRTCAAALGASTGVLAAIAAVVGSGVSSETRLAGSLLLQLAPFGGVLAGIVLEQRRQTHSRLARVFLQVAPTVALGVYVCDLLGVVENVPVVWVLSVFFIVPKTAEFLLMDFQFPKSN